MQTHLLTGAGSGIGAELARRLADRGDELVLVARSEERAEELATSYPGARTVVADLEHPASLALPTDLSTLDSLLHVAGTVDLGAVADLDAATWQRTMAVNLLAPVELTRLALPALRAGRGTVVFVNSGAGRTAHPQWSAYAASKFGLRAFADALRGEEAGNGLRVSTVYPGRTATPMQAKVHEQEGKAYDEAQWTKPGTVAEAILHILDLGPDATITELDLRPGPG